METNEPIREGVHLGKLKKEAPPVSHKEIIRWMAEETFIRDWEAIKKIHEKIGLVIECAHNEYGGPKYKAILKGEVVYERQL